MATGKWYRNNAVSVFVTGTKEMCGPFKAGKRFGGWF